MSINKQCKDNWKIILKLELLNLKKVNDNQVKNISNVGPSDITHIDSNEPIQSILKN